MVTTPAPCETGSRTDFNNDGQLNSTLDVSSFNDIDSTNAVQSAPHVSPSDIIPLPRAGHRKVSKKGRSGETRILTNTPVRDSVAAAFAAKKARKKR